MKPEDVGAQKTKVVLTARTGRHGLRHRLEEMGYSLSNEELDHVYEHFLLVADKKKEVFDEDLAALIGDEVRQASEQFHLEYLSVTSGTGTLPTGAVKIRTEDGTVLQAAACGDGPVDAAYEAIRQATGQSPKLDHYSIRSITGGTEAMGEATVRIESETGRVFIGRGVSTDIIEASAKAYVDAINRMVAVAGDDDVCEEAKPEV
jgi:2-isopropylmalate synthase